MGTSSLPFNVQNRVPCHFIASFHSVVTAFIALYALLSFSTLNFTAATLHGFCFCRPLSDIDIAPVSLPILTFSYRFSSLRSYSLNLPSLSLFFGVFSSLGVFTHGFVYPEFHFKSFQHCDVVCHSK